MGMPFLDGDDVHSQTNKEKMKAGIPLTDEDREGWLRKIREIGERIVQEQRSSNGDGRTRLGVVIACSALRKAYRDVLRGKTRPMVLGDRNLNSEVVSPLCTYFMFLAGDREVLLKRMQMRDGHFMKANMLESQLATLEEPGKGEEGVVVLGLEDEMEKQVQDARDGLADLAGMAV
jgi:gluconokinase